LSKKYAVVIFPEDQSVERVASSWVNSNRSLSWWPSYSMTKEKLTKLIRTAAEPNEKTWDQCSVRVLKTTGNEMQMEIGENRNVDLHCFDRHVDELLRASCTVHRIYCILHRYALL